MKPAYVSKTIIANILSIVIMILLSFQESPIFVDYGALIAGAIAVLNIVLRSVTSEPITWK